MTQYKVIQSETKDFNGDYVLSYDIYKLIKKWFGLKKIWKHFGLTYNTYDDAVDYIIKCTHKPFNVIFE